MACVNAPRAGLCAALLALATTISFAAAADEPEGEIGAESAVENEDLEALIAEAEPLYLANCRMCHGTRGTAGVPLAGNERVFPEWVAGTMIRGPGYMPSFDVLPDEEVAAIANFVANSWGNDFGLITPDDVAAMR
jgi:mono/diheme cytochrome c family protein